MTICDEPDCNREKGHKGEHCFFNSAAWEELFADKDKAKVNKAGYCTPRGGDKGGYQNHVYRNNKVIIPYERLSQVNLENYEDGYVIRVFPNQCFDKPGHVRDALAAEKVAIGENAFVLYRTHDDYKALPPLKNWKVRYLEKNGVQVTRRENGAVDKGEYILRQSRIGNNKAVKKGCPQGIFAPEYATAYTNYLSKAILAWFIIHTLDNPYDSRDFQLLEDILIKNDVLNLSQLENNHILVNGVACCPLCHRELSYCELHEMVSFEDTIGLENSSEQVEGSTRSTTVNLFHMVPLGYRTLEHKPDQIAWGHAACNTRLGQRLCIPYKTLEATGRKLFLLDGDTDSEIPFAYTSESDDMIRTSRGDVWVKITYHSTKLDD